MANQVNYKSPLLAELYKIFGYLSLLIGIVLVLLGAFTGSGNGFIASLLTALPFVIAWIVFLGIAELIDLIAQIAQNTAITAENVANTASNTYIVAQNTAPQGSMAGQPLP